MHIIESFKFDVTDLSLKLSVYFCDHKRKKNTKKHGIVIGMDHIIQSSGKNVHCTTIQLPVMTIVIPI